MFPKRISVSKIGEFGLIRQLAQNIKINKRQVICGIGDDAAVLRFPKDGGKFWQLLTTDMLVEGVHFKRSMGAWGIGRKALACNISDIAAMGGVPTHAVVSLGVPPTLDADFIETLYRDMNVLARRFKVSIVGGDTVKSSKLIINVALLGEVKKKNLVTRCGAKKGDKIFVTGELGRSLKTDKHLYFTPRIIESQFLVKQYKPTAMIDISDGLAGDLNHILEASGVGAKVYAGRIPRTNGASLKEALYDGEDFELLFTVSFKNAKWLIMLKKFLDISCIGEIVDRRQGYNLLDARGKKIPFQKKGFIHF